MKRIVIDKEYELHELQEYIKNWRIKRIEIDNEHELHE